MPHNELEGMLPDSVGNLSSYLQRLSAAAIDIKGNIPAGLF